VVLMDRRQHERYDLQASLSFSWKDSGGVRQCQKGLLSNISGGGFFVSTPDSPPIAVRVQVRVSLRNVFAGTPLVLRARARVVRVELPAEVAGRAGFAAAMMAFTLRHEGKKLIGHGIAEEG
jgi:hypothetical protein